MIWGKLLYIFNGKKDTFGPELSCLIRAIWRILIVVGYDCVGGMTAISWRKLQRDSDCRKKNLFFLFSVPVKVRMASLVLPGAVSRQSQGLLILQGAERRWKFNWGQLEINRSYGFSICHTWSLTTTPMETRSNGKCEQEKTQSMLDELLYPVHSLRPFHP